MEEKNPETEILQHTEIYSGKIVKLHVDTIRLQSGTETVREVVLHPGGVVALPILPDGRILLIRQFRYPLKKYILELPAGKLDTGHSPRDTIACELEEETGYKAGIIEKQFSFYTTPGICNEIIHFFVARNLTPVPQQLQEGEHITVEPHTPADCLKKIETGEIADGKTVLAILWHLRNQEVK